MAFLGSKAGIFEFVGVGLYQPGAKQWEEAEELFAILEQMGKRSLWQCMNI